MLGGGDGSLRGKGENEIYWLINIQKLENTWDDWGDGSYEGKGENEVYWLTNV